MATSADFYSLDLLPLPRFDDLTLSVAFARDKWTETRTIIGTVRQAEVGLGDAANQALDNLKHYCDQALGVITQFYQRGGSGLEPVIQVEGLDDIRKQFMAELPKAQSSVQNPQAADQAMVNKWMRITAPPSDTNVLSMGLIVAGLWLVAKAFSR